MPHIGETSLDRDARSAWVRPWRQFRLLLCAMAMMLPALLPLAAAKHRPQPLQIIAYIFPRNRALQPDEVAAGKLTRINYAFANIRDGRIVTGDPTDEANFATLVGLKQKNPSLQVLVSVGGWSEFRTNGRLRRRKSVLSAGVPVGDE